MIKSTKVSKLDCIRNLLLKKIYNNVIEIEKVG